MSKRTDLGMPFEYEPIDAGTFWLCGLAVVSAVFALCGLVWVVGWL